MIFNDYIKNVETGIQYIKDFSFENPEAPMTLMPSKNVPTLDINVSVDVKRLENNIFEVVTKFVVTALSQNDEESSKVNFIVSLDYAGIFILHDVPDEFAKDILVQYCPNITFPFARALIANITRDAGLPPVIVQPIDFSAMSITEENNNIN